MAQSFGQNSSLPPPLVVEACIPGTKEGVKKQLLTMINSIVFKVKNKGECFIMGSRHQETDKAIARLFSSVSRRLEPVMKHKAGVDPHRFPPFYKKPPMQIQVPSTASDVISYNSEGQLCPLPYRERRDLSNHNKMRTIQSRRPEKRIKNHVTLTQIFP